MARTTARDLVIDALRTSGAVAASAIPSDTETEHALGELNNLIDTWNIEGLVPYTNVTTIFTTVPNQAKYTIGTAGGEDIVLPRPNFIRSVAYEHGGVLSQVQLLDENNWVKMTRVSPASSVPYYAIYHRSYPSSAIELYPAPFQAYPVHLVSAATIGNYELFDDLNLPPGYYPALQYALAEVLSLQYGTDNLQPLMAKAISLKAQLKRMNYQAPRASIKGNPFVTGGHYDIYSDTWRQ